MKINSQRLWKSLMDMAKIGATEKGGNTRLALTDLDVQGRQLLIQWANEIGLSVRYDAIGNLFLRKSGIADFAAPVVMGSHLDTQPKGGRFDGIYGVLAGLEVLRSLHDHQVQNYYPIELAVWMNEEGARFTPAMMGSAVFTGIFDLQQVLETTDKSGLSVQSELNRTQQQGDLELGRKFTAYYEAHIEQGPVLEQQQNQIGVVTGGQGILWLDVQTTGKAAHAGTTPMKMRKDSMVGTAKMIVALEKMVWEKFPDGLITFGEMSIANSSRNTIPAQIKWTIDLRHPNDQKLLAMKEQTHEILVFFAKQNDLSVDIVEHWHSPATYFDSVLINTVRESVQELGLSHQDIVSGAGHDAINLAKHCPTTMIFIPCEGGLSHNEAENITTEQAQHGADVLLNAILKFDQQRLAEAS
ncbi:Zn-dependent hydrolase [Acinetobacter qingfengensis]|uniref:Zn-dependent hydrolase n=1 Tax=Acinetobacter qingfengensis TaxID=1262585 RepID=A0A1E7QYZ4_9GAMM|nr:Zn-dependent hydrolase [Acinetobacter qingfengensis]KAA8730985.1 Zn-dependent hydrolase [Acinetobacter qingfengensis]OEY92236.1 Zn-dependent hydrolase [Acinetobacter qingfengensis]